MRSVMNFLIFSTTIFVAGILCEDIEFESKKQASSDQFYQKRGAGVGGIVYASKQTDYASQSSQSPARTLAKPSPNSSNNNLYQNIEPHGQQQQYYELPKQLFSTQPQTFTVQQQQQQQPQLTYAFQPQAFKIGYAQPVQYYAAPAQHQVQYLNIDPAHFGVNVHQQPIFYQAPAAAAAPVVPQQQLVKVGYAQPVAPVPTAYAKVAPAPAATAVYTAAPAAQHVQYSAPATLTKIGYATPAIATQQHAAPLAQQSHVVATAYSPASAVSQFSYISPHVSYGSNGILTQTSYKTAASVAPQQHQQQQQLAYSATQPAVYAVAAVPTYLSHPQTLAHRSKIGYAAPAVAFTTTH